MSEFPPVMTEAEAIRYLRLDETGVKHPDLTLRRYRSLGLLRATRVGRRIVYLREELDAFVRRLTEGQPA